MGFRIPDPEERREHARQSFERSVETIRAQWTNVLSGFIPPKYETTPELRAACVELLTTRTRYMMIEHGECGLGPPQITLEWMAREFLAACACIGIYKNDDPAVQP